MGKDRIPIQPVGNNLFRFFALFERRKDAVAGASFGDDNLATALGAGDLAAFKVLHVFVSALAEDEA